MKQRAVWFLALGVAAGGFACSAADAAGDMSGSDAADGFEDSDGSGDLGIDGGMDSGDAGMGGLPQEVEDESFRAPVVSGRFLWSANPESGRVALIDGEALTVRILSAGLNPNQLAAVPGDEDTPAAVVLNNGSSDATWFRVEGKKVEQRKLGTHVGANSWSVGASGHWAVAYSIAEKGEVLDVTEGLQEISLLELNAAKPRVTRLTVGYRPSRVLVADDDSRAVVVSDDGISVIALGTQPKLERWVALGESAGRDVSLTLDGRFALVRRAGQKNVQVYDLVDGNKDTTLEFSATLTDLDLTAGGRAIAVMRDQKRVATFEFPAVLDDDVIEETTIAGETFGSAALSDDGLHALLYTNATPNQRVTVLDLTPGPSFLGARSLDTKSPVWSVTLSPDGRHAVVLGGNPTEASKSFAVVALSEERFPRVVGTRAPVRAVALSSGAALVTATGGTTHQAYLVGLPSLSVSELGLSSEPLAVGVLGELGLGFVAQAHAAGRVTLLDTASAAARTLTGFELSAEVVEK